VRDAAQLGIGALEPETCLAKLERAGHDAFGASQGIVRVEARRSAAGGTELVPSARPLGAEPEAWSAVVATARHEGPGPYPGAKRSPWPCVERARAEARAAGVEEALLVDESGRLVEGARSCVVALRDDGRAVLAPLARGGVRSVARELVLAARPDLLEADVSLDELLRAHELVALNAVRGARAIVRLDGRPVGAGTPGPLAAALRTVLDAAG
jgi:branched-subunit amino acid aminotransferase/4-amino-4-deoxychorismate lyase